MDEANLWVHETGLQITGKVAAALSCFGRFGLDRVEWEKCTTTLNIFYQTKCPIRCVPNSLPYATEDECRT